MANSPNERRRSRVLPWIGLGLVAVALTAMPTLRSLWAENTDQEKSEAVASVGDDTVTMEEVEEASAADLEKVELRALQCRATVSQQRHQVLENNLESVVRERMFAAEALAAGLDKDEWREKAKAEAVEEVTDEEIDAWWEANKNRVRQPKEQVVDQLRDYLAEQALVERLEEKYEVTYSLPPYRVEVAADGPSVGPEDAPVTIVEFSDFECPYCKRVTPTLERIREEYPDSVRLVFRQYPLANHPHARKAAEASLCAHEQGKFWEFHDLMFEEQDSLAPGDLKEKAKRLELDTEEFDQCLDSGKFAEKVEHDLREGTVAGVSGTPAMFVNGRFLSGAQPFESIAAVVEEELEGQESSKAN